MLSITLIEPSSVSLQQGISLIRQMFQNDASVDSIVKPIDKYIDALTCTDLVSGTDSIKIHLFSNIIDVEKFDLRQLYQLILDSFCGLNRFICTSPDNRRKQRLKTFSDFFVQSHSQQITLASSSNTAIYGEVFYIANAKYEKRRIGRCENQFTVNLT